MTDDSDRGPNAPVGGRSGTLARFEDWVERLRQLDRSPEQWGSSEDVGTQMIDELAMWIGEDESRLKTVAHFVEDEQDLRLWAPAIFSIGRCTAKGKREFVVGQIKSPVSDDKSRYAVLAGLEHGEARGSVSVLGVFRAKITNATDAEIVDAACDRLLKSTNRMLKVGLLDNLSYAATNSRARDAMMSIFVSPTEDANLRATAGSSLASAASRDPSIECAALTVIQGRDADEGITTNAIRILRNAETQGSKSFLADLVGDSSYPERVRKEAAASLSYASSESDVAVRLLRAYPAQPKSVKIAILETLERSRFPNLAEQIESLPPEQDSDLTKLREETISTITGDN